MSFLGKWKVVTKTPMGNTEAIWHIFEENGAVKATIFADNMLTPFDSIEVDGDKFVMEVKLKSLLGKMKFHMEGTVDGDTVSGNSKMKLGSSPFEGERLVEEAAPAMDAAPEAPSPSTPLPASGTKKVLGISFGHNMGNSELLLREALMGAEEAGAEVKLIRYNDFEVKHCIGCQACTVKMMSQGQSNLCVQKDDFPIIREALLDCDAIIYSAPIFLIRPIASLLVMADRIGPFHDVGGLESLGMNRPGSPIDQRLFKQRCAGFISVGGAVRSQYASMGLTLMNDLTYPMHAKVVDQLMVLDANCSGQALIHDDKVARARLLGKNVAENAGKLEADMKWCGDFEGTCPVCHGNLMTVDNGDEKVTCAICGIQGTMKLVDGKMKVDFAEEDLIGSRLTKEECAYHYSEIFESLGKFQGIAEEVKKREQKYRDYDVTMIKPEKKTAEPVKSCKERENLLKIYNGEVPDFIPDAANYIIEVPFPGDRYFGQGLVGDDAWGVNWTASGPDPRFDGQTPTPGTKKLTDITKWREQVQFPDLDELPVDLILPMILDSLTDDRSNVIVKGLLVSGTWERVNQLMGMEDAMCAFYEEPECLKELMEAIADYKIKCIDILCDVLDPDIVHMQDDWGADRSMMMSPDMWREFIKPIEKRYTDHIHSKGKLYEHHSCGYIKDIIPDLIEIGVDALNPINVSNNPDEIKKLYGDKIILVGMVDNQKIDFEDCSEEVIREEARRVLDAYSEGGRFIPYMFPTLERTWNVFYDEVNKYGRKDL